MNILYVHQIINLGADITLSGIRAQMLNSRNSLHLKTLCKYLLRLEKGYLLFQTSGRSPLLDAESFHIAAVYLREHSDLSYMDCRCIKKLRAAVAEIVSIFSVGI